MAQQYIQIRLANKTAAQWTSSNNILLQGQKGIESDTRLSKTGDGSTPWNSLSYDTVRAEDVIGLPTEIDVSGLVPKTYTVNSKALSGNIVLDQDEILDGTTYKQYSSTEKTKLSGIATNATANDIDANLKNRANHTGTQLAATISDFNSAALSASSNSLLGKQNTLVSGVNIKTINGTSVLGSGDLVITGAGGTFDLECKESWTGTVSFFIYEKLFLAGTYTEFSAFIGTGSLTDTVYCVAKKPDGTVLATLSKTGIPNSLSTTTGFTLSTDTVVSFSIYGSNSATVSYIFSLGVK